MKGKRQVALVIAAVMVLSTFGLALTGCGGDKSDGEDAKKEVKLNPMFEDFVGAVDTKYAYDLAVEISEDTNLQDSPLGSRTAGSDGEHKAADRLAQEMESIGLKDVEKVGVDVDKWQFNGATVQIDGEDTEIKLHSYATAATPKDGLKAEVVYVGRGTAADYEGKDVKGKIVLFDVNQRDDWWVTYPMLEAENQGAVGALACSNKGFSEISEEAYNQNDICGPTSIPTCSITQKDSKAIQEKLKSGKVNVTYKVDNVVEEGGTSYNVMGKIPGKNSDEMIIFGSHYDMYFNGFQDNCCAVAAQYAIAKAMIDSGYTPERDIVFIAHGSEEWGASATPFDWTTGAWRMINEAHPEWQGKALSFINFELPAYEFGDYTSVYSAPEMYTMIDRFVNEDGAPVPENCFKDGVLTDGYQTYTYSDDFSYYVAGVPSTVNGFLLQKDMETVFPFYKKYYHTNFDTKDTYNEDVFKFNIDFYGSLGIYIDQTPALQLNYEDQHKVLSEALDEEQAKAYGVDFDGYKNAVSAYGEAAKAAFAKVDDINKRYKDAEDDATKAEIMKEGQAANKVSLELFNTTVDELVGLMYEAPMVPHQAPQQQLSQISDTIGYLEKGDVKSACDESAWLINNVNEWYSMYFSKNVTDQFYDMFYDNKGNLFWGTDKEFLWADVGDASRSLIAKYEEENPDLSKELEIYQKAIEPQSKNYKKRVADEIKTINDLTKKLNEFAQ